MLHSDPRGSVCAVAFTVIEADLESMASALHGASIQLGVGVGEQDSAADG